MAVVRKRHALLRLEAKMPLGPGTQVRKPCWEGEGEVSCEAWTARGFWGQRGTSQVRLASSGSSLLGTSVPL